MGVLKDNPLGRLSGKIGDKSYRDCNGKTVVAALPNRDKNDHPNCAAPKDRFRHASRLASFTHKIPLLEKIWRIADSGSSSAFHSLMQANVNAASRGYLTTENIISPPGRSLKVTEVVISGVSIKTRLEISGGSIPPPLQAIVVIYACSPHRKNKNDFRFYSISSEVNCGEKGREFYHTFNSYPFSLNWMNNFRKKILYFTLIGDDGSVPPVWTSTAAFEVPSNIQSPYKNDPSRQKLIPGTPCESCHYSFTFSKISLV